MTASRTSKVSVRLVSRLDGVGVRSAGSIEERESRPSSQEHSRRLRQAWHQCPCWYKDSPDLKTVSCHSHNQRRPLQTKLQTLSKSLIASQLVLSPWTQVLPLPQCISGSARSWPSPGPVGGSTATGSHGPGSTDDNRNTRCRLDTFSNPDDENARSAVLLQFPCEQCHAGVSTWLNKFLATTDIPAHNIPTRIHCKTGSLSARLVFETRSRCQDFVSRFKDDGLPCTVESPFCRTSVTIQVRQSKSPEDREIGRRLETLWEVLAPKLQEILPEKDAKGNFFVPALNIRAQVLSTYDRRNGVGKPVFKLAPLGHEQVFDVTAPNLCEPYVSDVVLQQIVCEASTPAQIREANV